jgi:hypothetical protein
MDSLVTYRNTKKISCLIFLSTATSSILFDGGPKANARAEATHRERDPENRGAKRKDDRRGWTRSCLQDIPNSSNGPD